MARQDEKNKAKGLSASVATPTAGAILPLAVGAGIGAHSIYSTRNKILKDIFARTNSSTVSKTQDLIRNIKSGEAAISVMDLGAKIRDLNSSPWHSEVGMSMRKEHVLNALEQSSRALTDNGVRSNLINSVKNFHMADIANRTDEDLIKFIASHPAFKNTSHVGRRAGMRFIENVRAIKSSIKSNQSLNVIKGFTPPSFKDLGPAEEAALDSGLLSQIDRFVSSLGTTQKPIISRMRREGMPGSTLRVQFKGGLIGKNTLPLYIPETIPGTGIVVSGKELESQNIVGSLISVDKGGRIKGLHKPEEWIMMRANEQLIPEIKAMRSPDSRRLQRLTKAFRKRENVQALSTFEDETRRAYQNVPRLLNGGRNPHQALLDDSMQRVRFVSESGELLNRSAAEQIIKNFPEYEKEFGLKLQAVSNGTASGASFRVLSHTTPISGKTLPSGLSPAPFADLYPTSRKPYQRYKPYTPSSRAAELLSKDELTQSWKFAQGDIFGNQVHGPAALTFYKGHADAGLEEGMLWVDAAQKAKYQIESITQPLMSLKDAAPLMNQLQPVKGKPGVFAPKNDMFINAGEYLGYKEDGSALLSSNRMKVLEATAFENKLRLSLSEQLPLEDYSKLFGTDKGMRGWMDRKVLMAEIAKSGGAAGASVSALGHASNLKKNRALHLFQMFSATVEFNKQNMRHLSSTDALSLMNKLHVIAGNQGFEAATRELVATANRTGLGEKQQALTFGALLHSHPDDLASFGLSDSVINRIKQSGGAAVGVGHHFSGGPKTMTGADGKKMATLEPRLYQILNSGHFGSFGPELAQDLQARSVLSNVDALRSSEELTKTITSLSPHLSQKGIGTAGRVEKLSTMSSNVLDPDKAEYIFNTGGHIDFEGLGGLGKVHIPHGDHMKELTQFRTNADQVIQSDMTHEMLNFLEQAREAKLTGGDFEDVHNKFAASMMKHRADIISGKGGLASGRITGSRLLTGITPHNSPNDTHLARIGQSHFEGMLNDMKGAARNTLAGSELDEHLAGLERMNQAFLSGEEVGGAVLRHPLIGPHSIAPMRFKLDPNITDNVVALPNVYKTIKMDGENMLLRFSAMIGHGGDTDADTYGVVLGNPGMEARFRGMARSGSEYMQRYEDFAFKAQAMKIRAGGGLDESLAAGAMKLSAAENHVGRISTNMTRAKMALLNYSGQTDVDSIHNALQMVEFVEQGPISGKHLTNETAMNMPSMMADITGAFDRGTTARDMPTVLEGILKPGAMDAISKDSFYEHAGRRVELKAVNQGKAWETIDAALAHFGSEKDIGSAARREAVGKGRLWGMGVNEIGEHLNALEGGILNDFSEHISEPRSIARGIASAAETIATHMKANKKTYMVAGAASLAVAAALSAPQGSIEAPIQYARMNNGTGDKVTPENITPDGRVNGSPTAPTNLPSPAPIRSNNPSMAAHIRVRGRMNGQGNPTAISGGVRNALGAGTSVNTKVSDDRSSLTAQKLQDIMSR